MYLTIISDFVQQINSGTKHKITIHRLDNTIQNLLLKLGKFMQWTQCQEYLELFKQRVLDKLKVSQNLTAIYYFGGFLYRKP